ncbi:MAG: hypothetical protein WBL44_00570 [Nitrososphaeraceae archaeon]|jgi:hypothetical protein
MGKKNREINIIKNPQDRDVIFISDPLREIIRQQQHKNQQENDSSGNNYRDDKKKLVKNARHDSNRSSKHDLKNRSKQGLSKQSHSPVYE